jgi:hypothetical protein
MRSHSLHSFSVSHSVKVTTDCNAYNFNVFLTASYASLLGLPFWTRKADASKQYARKKLFGSCMKETLFLNVKKQIVKFTL